MVASPPVASPTSPSHHTSSTRRRKTRNHVPTLFLVELVRTEPNQKMGCWIRGNAVAGVAPGKAAEAAGIRVGMRVLEVDGWAVEQGMVSSLMQSKWRDVGQFTVLLDIAPPPSRLEKNRESCTRSSRISTALYMPGKQDTPPDPYFDAPCSSVYSSHSASSHTSFVCPGKQDSPDTDDLAEHVFTHGTSLAGPAP